MLKNVCAKKYAAGEGSYEIIVVYINYIQRFTFHSKRANRN